MSIEVMIPEGFDVMNETTWIGVTAEDRHGLQSELSNVASARYIAITMKPFPVMLVVYIIIGLVVATILIIILMVVVCARRKRSQRNQKTTDQKDILSSGTNSAISEEEIDSYLPLPDVCIISHPIQRYNTFRSKPLPSTKRAISIKSVKNKFRLSKSKTPAPSPSTYEPSRTIVRVSNTEPLETRNGQISEQFADDLIVGEGIAKGVVDQSNLA